MHMSELKDIITSYNNLPFSDRTVFFTTISNDISISDDLQSFLVETRFASEGLCIYCHGKHVVKMGNGRTVFRGICVVSATGLLSQVPIPSPHAHENPLLSGRHT